MVERRERKRRARNAARKTKRCPNCERAKPLTSEHYYLREGGGLSTAYCKACCRALQRLRYHSDPDFRRRRKEAAARSRARALAEDREAALTKRRAWNRSYAERLKRRRQEPPEPQDKTPTPSGPRLPVRPLLEVIDHRAQTFTTDDPVALTAEVIGVDQKALSSWRSGSVKRVSFAVADHVLTRLDLLWHDVWPPEQYPNAAAVWEGT
jgi:hypothetical protein